jgi:hypothetical protein
MEATLEKEAASVPTPAPAPARPSAPLPTRDLERPAVEGGGTASNPETFYMILEQLKQGEGASLKPLIKNDLKQYGDNVEFPLKKFINKYKTLGSTLFKALPPMIRKNKVVTVPTEILSGMINFFEGVGGFTKPQKRGTSCMRVGKESKCYGGNLNYVKLFLLDFFRAYVQQYRIERASTIEEKVTSIYPEFETYLGTVLKGGGLKVSLFDKLNLTKEVFTQYSKEAEEIGMQTFPEYNIRFQTFVPSLYEDKLTIFINVV